VSEPPDWKQKYRDSLLEMESEEKRWLQIEQALRRLVGRLCAAGMGVDPRLDDELIALAAANRRNADASELEQLAAALTTAVVAVDAVAPIPTVIAAPSIGAAPTAMVRWDSTCSAAQKVLLHLASLRPEEGVAQQLATELTNARTDAELADVLEKAAELIHGYGDTLARERLQAASVLANVTTRLEEMAGYLSESSDQVQTRFADSAAVNDNVISQVRELTAQVGSATELAALQTLVGARLESVTKKVLDFRSREESRLLEHNGRAERMKVRIADLERQTQDLHSKLTEEKHGARLDPLTRVANRKSFDERFAQALLGRTQSDKPVVLLLWDLDNFKIINDTYGHRAGDRVLQSVATCFASGLRAEDFVARIGGEEFVTLLTGVPFARALIIANELRTGVAALRFHFRGAPVRVTVSCGITELRSDDAVAPAFDRADAALYQAKHAGKNACIAA